MSDTPHVEDESSQITKAFHVNRLPSSRPMTKPASCPACHGEGFQTLEKIDLDEQHAFYSPDKVVQKQLTEHAAVPDDSYQMLRCNTCGLEFASPLVPPSARWYELSYPLLDAYPGNRWEFEVVLASTHSTQRLYEIGCGAGSFLKQCRSREIAAAGTDFSASAVAKCVDSGLSATVMDIAGAEAPQNSGGAGYDVIASFHVLEHVADPYSFFKLATSLAADQAHLWVAVPSDRRPSRVFGERDFLDQPPHHMTRWTESALASVAEPHSWSLAAIQYEPLPLRSALWWSARRNSLYRRFVRHSNGAGVERLVRYLLYPYLLCAFHRLKRQSGLTMLAHYVKSR